MIITRTPLRMSFAGGGSDMHSYYEQNEGAVISTSINRYVYINVNEKFDGKYRVSYSITEHANKINDLNHPLVKEALKLLSISHGLEITSIADIPSEGTGLGSSSAFTVGLAHALLSYEKKPITKEILAELACEIEIEKCKEPIGKQDQYAAAFGDLNFIEFLNDGSVKVNQIDCDVSTREALENNLLVFYTGISRSSSSILKHQSENIKKKEKISIMKKMVQLAHEMRYQLESNNITNIGEILHENWILKKQLTNGISNKTIDSYYDIAMKAGAKGGKLMGAGSGGFLLFLVDKDKQHKVISMLKKLKHVDIQFDRLGSKIIYTDTE